jgi:transcriptional regulator with XRE-family HTH domain
MGENRHFPHQPLGSYLRKRRESIHESLAEVSGAVEIDEEMLSKIEQGLLLPTEDILLLLISHLSINEDEAVTVWEMAGYEHQKPQAEAGDQDSKQMFMVIPFDNRILYTDEIQVTANQQGIVLNFMQSGNNQPTTISRIGMSRDYAKTMIKILKHSLEQKAPAPRMLPKPVDKKEKHQ